MRKKNSIRAGKRTLMHRFRKFVVCEDDWGDKRITSAKARERRAALKEIENEINDKIDEWHSGKSKDSLADYLGMTPSEYAKFVTNPTKYFERKVITMVDKKTWDEFRKTGIFWWMNRMLHTFGWVIAVEVDDDNNVINAFPARCKFRGFTNEIETRGFSALHQYLKDNINEIQKETEDNK